MAGTNDGADSRPRDRTSNRISFTPGTRESGRPATSNAARHSRTPSIPQVLGGDEKDRRQRQKEHEDKQVNIDEHLMTPEAVAARYKTTINLERPADSQGMTSQHAENSALIYGRNVLTPPKKKNPFLKYLGYLTSLFNLLLIVAGLLEYLLLAIDFKDNFPNVSTHLVYFSLFTI